MFPALAERLSPLAPPPVWAGLERFQETITRDEFTRLLDGVYAPGNAAREVIQTGAESATIRTSLTPPGSWTLRFAASREAARPVPRAWRPRRDIPPGTADRPLAGVRIAIDPGHIGGDWARMEERWFRIGETLPVMEGGMTLRVGELLAERLRALGAEVSMVRETLAPVSATRPADLVEQARAELARQGNTSPREGYADPDDPRRGDTVQWQSEFLFYRAGEIRARAELVNSTLRPDITVCLHFNAEAWGEPRKPSFVPRNHLHLLVNGAYSAGELRQDDVRFDMLVKLLEQGFDEELAASEAVAASLARETGLPPFHYPTPNAIRVGDSPYVWARNLLANRLYRTPVIFLEPYVMNSEVVWERVQAGDYEGERTVGGRVCRSIYREYADGVAAGLVVRFGDLVIGEMGVLR